ncbi:MAG TPA: YihY/virulence factor BrkB family protein [Nocardioidaceae bacterium]|jgi:membrane protein|nr:YihY/virulence factor BrkB family protein [Nocardioidaceae bacterium]
MATSTGPGRSTTAGERPPGSQADSPAEIPAKGWFQITKRSLKEVGEDNLTLIAGGIAYSWFLSLFPMMIAAVSIYGLVVDPSEVQAQVDDFASGLPQAAQDLILKQLQSISSSSGGGMSLTLILSIALALWSASAGMAGLVQALNIAYDEKDERNFVIKRGLAILLTIGFLVFIALAIILVGVFPIVLSALGTNAFVTVLAQIIRVVVLVATFGLFLALLYRVAPHRDAPQLKWLSLGAIVATVIWVVASVLFSFYVDNFGSYSETYGALAGVVVLLLWFWLTALVILLGAEINAETEAQTEKDSTTGPPQPLGQRQAVKADEPPPAD